MSDARTLMTVDEFIATADEREGRWEIEDGVAFAMAPERLEHSDTKFEAVAALRAAIGRAKRPCRAVLDGPAVRITPRSAYQPDALVYFGPRLPPDTREIPNPVIVVEVISPSSEGRDTHRKLLGYFTVPSIMHYLILDPRDGTSVAHYRRGEAGVIELRILYNRPLLLDPPGLELTVAELFPAD